MDRDQSDFRGKNRMTRLWQVIGSALYLLLLSAEPHAFARSPQFTTTIFICAVETLPEKCDAQTAIDIANGPSVTNETMCGRDPQAMIGQTALVPRAGIEYLKIECRRGG